MATGFIVNVPENFDLSLFCNKLTSVYCAKGFKANSALFNANSCQISFDRGTGGINVVLGLGIAIKANCTLNGNTMTINFTEAEWTSKIIGCVVGWFLCFIPIITAIVGIIKQINLPKEIENDINMVIGDMR